MKKLKQIKKQFKTDKIWKKYKTKFKHKQMKFIFSKVALVYKSKIENKDLVEIESIYLNSDLINQERMFDEVISKLKGMIEIKADWKSFASYMFYVYQTSTYYQDINNSINNVFSKENYVAMNNVKRTYFNKWLDSLDNQDKNFNTNVIKILKVVT